MGSTGEHIKRVLRGIPVGRVASYGSVAAMAGLPNGARTVARLLHTSSRTDDLPWWRVVRANGSLALRPGFGLEEQRARLEAEGVRVDAAGRVRMSSYEWSGDAKGDEANG